MKNFMTPIILLALTLMSPATFADNKVRGLEEISDIDAWTLSFTAKGEAKNLDPRFGQNLWSQVSAKNSTALELFKNIKTSLAGPYSDKKDVELLARELYLVREKLRHSGVTADLQLRKKLSLLALLADEALLATALPQDIDVVDVKVGDPQGCAQNAPLNELSLCSGDVLVSKGGAGSSSFLARIPDFPGNYSHSTMAYIGQKDGAPKVFLPEAVIEDGTKLRDPIADYTTSRKTKLFAYRLQTTASTALLPDLAAKAFVGEMAKVILSKGLPPQAIYTETSLGYDAEMNALDSEKMICSEVVLRGYDLAGAGLKSFNNPYVQELWSSIKDKDVSRFFKDFLDIGPQYFPAPSDIELNPAYYLTHFQINRAKLKRDRMDLALIDVLIESLQNNPQSTKKFIAFFKDKGEMNIAEIDLQKFVDLGFLTPEAAEKIKQQLPQDVNLKQAAFFGFLDKVLTPFVRTKVDAEVPQSELLGPLALRKVVAKFTKEKLKEYLSKF